MIFGTSVVDNLTGLIGSIGGEWTGRIDCTLDPSWNSPQVKSYLGLKSPPKAGFFCVNRIGD